MSLLSLWKTKLGRIFTANKSPYRQCEVEFQNDSCNHGVTFDREAARGCDEHEVRRRWPRLDGACPLGCGYEGIGYAGKLHYVMGDW